MKEKRKIISGFNKKAQDKIGFLVIITIIVIVFSVYALVNVASYKIFSEFRDDVSSDSSFNESLGMDVINDYNTSMPQTLDNSVLIILGLLALIIAVLSYNALNNKILFIVIIIIFLFLIIASMILSNVWDEYTSSSEYDSVVDSFPVTNFVMGNMPYVIIAYIGLSLLAISLKEVL